MEDLIYGDYEKIPDSLPAEVELGLTVNAINLSTHWFRCDLVSNFLSAFIGHRDQDGTPDEEARFANISIVFNEIVENAVKFSAEREGEIAIQLRDYSAFALCEIRNLTTSDSFEKLKKVLDEIFATRDYEELYLKKLKAASTGVLSGTGLLMLLKDYNTELAARLSKSEGGYRVTVRATIHEGSSHAV